MNRHDQDQLLNEILTGERLASFRHATLESGLGTLRCRRRRRHFVKACSLACLPLAAGFGLLFRISSLVPKSAALSRAPDLLASSVPNPTPGVKIITDEELFSLFPNRPLALVGKPGHQQLVFLDRPQTRNEAVTQ